MRWCEAWGPVASFALCSAALQLRMVPVLWELRRTRFVVRHSDFYILFQAEEDYPRDAKMLAHNDET